MATVYKQSWSKYDGKLGKINFEFVISDDYYELYDQTVILESNIFQVGNINEDLDIDVGIQATDDLSFTINEVAIKTTNDTNCYAFTLQGLEQTTKRYVALYINPASNGDVNALVFAGQIDYSGKGTDLKWEGVQWGTAQNPTRQWQLSSTNIGSSFLEDISILQHFVTINNDNVWKTANVQAKRCFPDLNITDKYVQIDNLVLLPILLEKLKSEVEIELQTSYPGLTITFVNSDSSIEFTPGKPEKKQVWGKQTLNGFVPELQNPERLRILGTGGNNCYVDFNMIQVYGNNNIDKEHSFMQYATFTELLYAIAISFGNFVKFTVTAKTNINIEFVPRQQFSLNQSYLIDAESAVLNIEYADNDNENNIKYWGLANNYAIEGNDNYYYNDPFDGTENAGTITPSKLIAKEKKEGKKLLFTVSPTIYRRYKFETIPHNSQLLTFSSGKIERLFRYYGITTAIYQTSIDHSIYVRPCTQASVNIDGNQQAFDKLANCVNSILSKDGEFYKNEYEITVPYINGFSYNADGSSNSWKSIKTGDKIVVDSINYTIIGKEIDIDNLNTKLRLHKMSQYAYTQPASNLMTLDLSTLALIIPTSITIGVSAETLGVGIAVYLNSFENKWKYAYSESVNGALVEGVTLSSAGINQSIQIHTGGVIAVDGIVGFEDWDWQPGKNEGLFVRAKKGITTGLNISQTELDEKSGTEDFYIRIGYPITNKKVNLDFSEQWIFED